MAPRERRALLLTIDLLVGWLAFAIAVFAWYVVVNYRDQTFDASLFVFTFSLLPFWFYLLPFGWLILLVDLYDPHRASSLRVTLRGIMTAAMIGLVFYALIYLFAVTGTLPRIGVGVFVGAASALTFLWRIVYIRIFTSPAMLQRVLVVGAGKAGRTLVQAYRDMSPPPFHLVGFIDDDPTKAGSTQEALPVLGSSDRLLEMAERQRISTLIVAITGEIKGSTLQILLDAQEKGVEILRMPSVYEDLLGRVPIHHLETDWMVRSFIEDARASGYYELFKRLIDILAGLAGMLSMIVLVPLLGLLIAIDSGFPIFYSQDRLGRGGRPFRILKFRTMVKDAEADGQVRVAEENDPRITRVGNFLRVTRLDEWPQFLNVLRGEMSLVGPRAERHELVLKYQQEIPFYRARLLVKPGLTGWSQVNYGYAATVEDTTIKLEYDLFYIKHRSLYLDFVTLLRTVGTVVSLRGR